MPKEKMAEENKRIVFYAGVHDYLCWGIYKNGKFLDDPFSVQEIIWESEQVSKWAYLDDIINSLNVTSKALDVAVKALTNLAEPDGKIMRGYSLIADGALKDIEEIIGGK